MIKSLIKAIINFVVKPIVLIYLSVERSYKYDGIQLIIMPGVFHPGIFFSTKLLLKFLGNVELEDYTFLELGAGSGLISIYAAKQKAIVTATDISKTAISNIEQNAERNNVAINVIKSDLFNALPQQPFDIITINPPYYPEKPINEKDFAWYCGKNFEYFENLFLQLENYVDENSKTFMILSEDCQIARIQQIALKNSWEMRIVFQKRILWEMNYIFKIISKTN